MNFQPGLSSAEVAYRVLKVSTRLRQPEVATSPKAALPSKKLCGKKQMF